MLLAVFYYNSLIVKSTEALVNQTNLVINKNNEILLEIVNVETSVRGFVLTNKIEFLQPFNESQQKIVRNLSKLLILTKDNPTQQARIKKLEESITRRIQISKSLIENQKASNRNKEFELATLISGKRVMDSIRENINNINFHELQQLNQRKKQNSASLKTNSALLIIFFILMVVLLIFIYFIFKDHYKVNTALETHNKSQQAASQYSLSLIEASLDPLVTINNEGKITDLNQATVSVTGANREQLIGSDFFDYFTDHQKAREVYQDVFSKGSVVDAPLTIRHKDGKLTDVLFNGSVYKDELGITKGVVIVARDIAEQKWALDLRIANTELAFQNEEKEKRAAELALANKELEYQNSEKEDRANELLLANEELAFQNQEKENRANELTIANKELEYQNKIKEKKAAELIIANKELAFQNEEKEKRAQELIIANKELLFQKGEKQNRADELGIANIELAHQQSEKQNRADELVIANKELLFQTDEKQNRADELEIADKELDFQNEEKEKRVNENKDLEAYNSSLKLASQYARSLIEASLDPLVTINAEGKITDVNNASINVTGVTREKLVGTDFSNYFTEPEKAQKGYRQAFENGFVEGYPLTIKHVDGNLVDVLYNASVYKDDNGNVLGVFAAARDITEQNKEKVKSEMATNMLEDSNISLKLASQYSRSLIEASLDPLVTINAEGKITDVNNASIKVTGVERDKIVGTDFSNYFTEPEKAQKGYRQVFEHGFVEDYPLTIKHVDGKLVDVLYNASVYKDDNGNVLGVFAAARDITEQNKEKVKSAIANKKLEDTNVSLKLASKYSLSLIEASRDPLFTISPEGKITDTNQASVNATDVSKENLIGSDFIDYFTDPEKAKKGYKEIFSKGFVIDYPLVIKDHKLTDVLFNGSVYKDDNGNVIGAVAVARDITEQKRYEKELTEAKVFAELATSIAEDAKIIAESASIKAEEAVKSKQSFLSNMSHEIRTPMNAIIGFTKVVLKTELTANQKEYLTAIKLSGDALIVLINDILDLAKVDAGKMTFEKTPFKLNLSIKAMLHLFETKIQEKNLKLITHYDKNIPEILVGDPIRLHQIILNLVSNAVKFTNQGSITVRITQIAERENEVDIQFEIEDTGIGIKEKKIEEVFENFQQATSGTSRLFGGTGLGLAIVKQLVQAQNGTINVISEFGKGSTFSFILSFMKTAINTVLEPEIIELSSDVKDTKILVVEDMELNQLLMKTILDDFGFECEIASNGKIAIEKLEAQTAEKPFDIILMDLQMPEMNGFEATEYIRKKMKSTIPIIALTADVTTVDVAKCQAVGMDDYISKPVDERLLYSKLIGLIKKPVVIIEQTIVNNVSTEKIKYVDLTYLTKLTKSNPILMSELINSYLHQTPALISTMKQSFQDKDWKLLNATVHKMLPSFSIMGMSSDINEIAIKIQEYATAIECSQELADLVLELENVCMQSCRELEFELTNLN